MPIDDMELCGCGKPLHYTDRAKRLLMDDLVARLGPNAVVTYEGRTWHVPRHFIALHSLQASELPQLAKKYGFKEVTTDASKPK